LCITFLSTLFISITIGILIGVLGSLLLMVYRTSNPHFAELGKIKNSDYYKNVKRFGDEIQVRHSCSWVTILYRWGYRTNKSEQAIPLLLNNA